MDVIKGMLEHIELPKFVKIKQSFDPTKIEDVVSVVNEKFQTTTIKDRIKPGQTIGITVGSRGIANMKEIVKCICDNIKTLGGVPIILPSMGSHGGAIAEGQVKVIEHFGITEAYCGAEIRASMDVVQLGTTDSGLPVYYDKIAYSLDGVIVLGRIKAHTDLIGDIESGLHKMIVIGLGDHKGAQIMHEKGLDKAVPRLKDIARFALKNANIIYGIGLIENAYDETHRIEFIPSEEIAEKEGDLLEYSRTQLPGFLFNDIDILIVDTIGKNISGNGMDPNIIGRGMIGLKNKEIRINKIVTLDTTVESGTNAFGVGLSDITTRRIFDKVELEAMYANAITAIAINGVRLPIAMSSDKLAIQCAIRAACVDDLSKIRVARIKDTLSLSNIIVSEALAEELKSHSNVEILGDAVSFEFDENDNLTDLNNVSHHE